MHRRRRSTSGKKGGREGIETLCQIFFFDIMETLNKKGGEIVLCIHIMDFMSIHICI